MKKYSMPYVKTYYFEQEILSSSSEGDDSLTNIVEDDFSDNPAVIG